LSAGETGTATEIETVIGKGEVGTGNDQNLSVGIGPKVIAKWATNVIFRTWVQEELVRKAPFRVSIGQPEKDVVLEIVASFYTMDRLANRPERISPKIVEALLSFVSVHRNALPFIWGRIVTDEKIVMCRLFHNL